MGQFAFGSGSLWGTRQDVANSTPQQFGVLQEGTVEFSGTIKGLYGQKQFPVAIGRGTGKITGSAKFGQLNGALFFDLYFGQSTGSGLLKVADNEVGTVPATTTFTVTVTNSATWAEDLGVRYGATGLPLKKVGSSPEGGEYSVAAGVYTFSSDDASAKVLISYSYTGAGTGANNKTVITNQLLGVQATFSVMLKVPYGGKQLVMKLNSCVSEKLSFGTKLEDFMIPQFDFQAMADAADEIGTFSLEE